MMVAMSNQNVPDAKAHPIDRELTGDDALITRPGQPVVTTPPAAARFDAAWFEAVRITPKGPQLDAVALVRQMRDEEWP